MWWVLWLFRTPENIFSRSVGCPFTLLVVSVVVQRPFSLIGSHLFIFVFVTCAFGVTSMKSLPRRMSWSYSSMCSSSTFTGSGLVFKSLIHLSLFFYSKIQAQFHSFAYGHPISPTSFVQEIILSLLCILRTLVRDQLTIHVWIHFWALSSIPLVCLSLCQFHTVLIMVALYYVLKSGHIMPPAAFFLIKIDLAIHGLLCFIRTIELYFLFLL